MTPEDAAVREVEQERRIMALVDDYADAFHAARRPDGSIQAADGFVAKVRRDILRAALRDVLREVHGK